MLTPSRMWPIPATPEIAAVIPDKWYEEGGLANLPEELQKNDDIVSKLGSARVNILMKTWRNPVVSDNYEPGSTFKLMTVATAYELGEVNEDSSFYCGGSLMVGDWKEPINCANTSGHGMQTLTEALMNSCNVAMMQIVQKVGMARFYEFYKAFGLLDQTGIDLPGESRGQFHNTSETSDWNEVALATASFGQRFQALHCSADITSEHLPFERFHLLRTQARALCFDCLERTSDGHVHVHHPFSQ